MDRIDTGKSLVDCALTNTDSANGSTAIYVDGVSKIYKLYDTPLDRVKESILPFSKRYHHDFYALQDVGFCIKKGETVGIIGNNGSGKSTLLKIISGVLTPSTGKVAIEGKISALLELGTGFNPELTGIENVFFNGTLLGYSREQMESKLDSILSFADIGDFANQPVKMYSSGMFIRLAFSVAICVDPEILIVDEALSVGDIFFQAKCMSALDKFRRNGASILFVSHSISTIRSLCDRVIYLKNGRLHCIGDAAYVTSLYSLDSRNESNVYLSEASEASVITSIDDTKHDVDEAHLDLDRITFKADQEFKKRVAAFRNGTGEAQVTAVELLNVDGNLITEVDFNEEVVVRVHLIFVKACNIAVAYYVRDNTNTALCGSTTILEGAGLVTGLEGEKKIIDFTSRLPLQEGAYNIQVNITVPIIINKSAKFVDVIENAVVFCVMPKEDIKVWSKLYVRNKVNVYNIND